MVPLSSNLCLSVMLNQMMLTKMVFALCMLWTTLVIPNTMGLGGFFRHEDRMVFHLSKDFLSRGSVEAEDRRKANHAKSIGRNPVDGGSDEAWEES